MIKFLKRNFFILIIGITGLIIGLFCGISYQQRVMVEIDPKIRYSEILNWATTIFVGIIIGYFLKNKYENNKIVKSYLLNDLQNILTNISELGEFCYSFRKCTKFDESQRKEIVSKIDILDKKIKVFSDLLSDFYQGKYKDLNENLVNNINSFNKKITCDRFYAEPLEQPYFDEIISESTKFQGQVRKAIIKVINEM